MPTPDSWHRESERILRRDRWHTCDCSACDCEQILKGADICPACRDGYHLAPEPDAA